MKWYKIMNIFNNRGQQNHIHVDKRFVNVGFWQAVVSDRSFVYTVDLSLVLPVNFMQRAQSRKRIFHIMFKLSGLAEY